MVYRLVAGSRSGATEVYQGEDGTFVEVSYFRSGRSDAVPVPAIPSYLTVRYENSDVLWETEPITAPIEFPAMVGR